MASENQERLAKQDRRPPFFLGIIILVIMGIITYGIGFLCLKAAGKPPEFIMCMLVGGMVILCIVELRRSKFIK